MSGERWGAPSVTEALRFADSSRMAGPSGDQYAITLADEVIRLRGLLVASAELFDAHGLPRHADGLRRRMVPMGDHSSGGEG